jgi:hypothetical protein
MSAGDEIKRVAAEVDAPLVFNVVPSGHSPEIDEDDLERLGFKLAIYPGALLGPVVSAMARSLAGRSIGVTHAGQNGDSWRSWTSEGMRLLPFAAAGQVDRCCSVIHSLSRSVASTTSVHDFHVNRRRRSSRTRDVALIQLLRRGIWTLLGGTFLPSVSGAAWIYW